MIHLFNLIHNQKNTQEEIATYYDMLGISQKELKSSAKKDPKYAKIAELQKWNFEIEKLEEGKENGHTLRVAHLAKRMADELELDTKTTKSIYFAGLFHDIGKHLISKDIIGKPGPLTDEEYEIVKTHVELARDLLKDVVDEDTLEIIEEHHERMDRSGYPQGIIPNLGARIIGIVDSYDAMTSRRVYNDPKSKEIAFQELKRCTLPREKGGFSYLYDEDLVDLLIKLESTKED